MAYRPVLDLWRRPAARLSTKPTYRSPRPRRGAKCIDTAPEEITLCGRTTGTIWFFRERGPTSAREGTALNILDIETSKRRSTTKRDVAAAAPGLCMPGQHRFFRHHLLPLRDRKATVDVNRFYASITNTSRTSWAASYTVEGIRKLARMAELIAGSKEAFAKRPFMSMITCIMSPLLHRKDYTELMETACLMNIPLATPTAPMTGSSAPASLAGTLVQMNVEALAGIVTTRSSSRPSHALLRRSHQHRPAQRRLLLRLHRDGHDERRRSPARPILQVAHL